MMHDSPPRIDPVLNLARNQMELITDIHRVHLVIVSGKDETQVLQFEASDFDRMMTRAIPSVIHEIRALGVIVSSPVYRNERYGAIVTLIDRTTEAFYVPIVRVVNADTLVGDFRPTTVVNSDLFDRIHAELEANWLRRGDD
jgi:hypothetical protein